MWPIVQTVGFTEVPVLLKKCLKKELPSIIFEVQRLDMSFVKEITQERQKFLPTFLLAMKAVIFALLVFTEFFSRATFFLKASTLSAHLPAWQASSCH